MQVSHYATISCRRLARIGASGRRQERKPTLEEIEQARVCVSKDFFTIIVPLTAFYLTLVANLPAEHVWKHSRRNHDGPEGPFSAPQTAMDTDDLVGRNPSSSRCPNGRHISVCVHDKMLFLLELTYRMSPTIEFPRMWMKSIA